jgi:predicted ribosome quality control (RQC) complex YloA/Tae2 family protein
MIAAMNVLLLKAWLSEQGPALIGARLRQVRQHDERTLLFDLEGEDGPCLLLLSVLEEYPALCIVAEEAGLPAGGALEGNFAKALNFHLAGSQLVGITQEGFDRSVVFTFTSRDIYGQETLRQLRHELVGRSSNAFLLTERGMVVSIMKRVRREQNRVRNVMTGKPLPPPPPLDKYIAQQGGVDGLADELAGLAGREGVEDAGSVATLFARRVAACDLKLWEALEPYLPVEHDLDTLYEFILQFQRGDYTARLFGIGQDGRSANDIASLGWRNARQKRGAYAKPPDVAQARLAVRLDQLHEQRAAAGHADELEQAALEMLRQAADLDASGEGPAQLGAWQQAHPDWAGQVALDRSVYDNAQNLIHYAQRLRRGIDKLDESIQATEEELARLESPRPQAARPKPGGGLGRGDEQRLNRYGVKYLRFRSSDGFEILCGLSDTSNDGLLRAFGSSRHLWLHARDFAGSHVIVLSAGRELPRRTIEEAAVVAAYYSQGKKDGEVEVSYLPLKQLKRVPGGKPGQVLKQSEKVLIVRPEAFEEIKSELQRREG